MNLKRLFWIDTTEELYGHPGILSIGASMLVGSVLAIIFGIPLLILWMIFIAPTPKSAR